MTAFPQIKRCFDEALERFEQGPAITALMAGKASVDQYASILRQIYFQARENPQIQAYSTARFRGAQRDSVRRFLQHATAEIGHDQLARNDLDALGFDTTDLPSENPAPSTISLTAFAYYQSAHLNAVGYLGYLFFLEFMPTSAGHKYGEQLLRAGVPKEALSFLMEHAHVDVAHNRLMEKYVDSLVVSEDDLAAVKYAVRVTGDLYAKMLEQAMFDPQSQTGWGRAPEEQARLLRAAS